MVVACFCPNVSVKVDGNKEKISPQPKNTIPDKITNMTGSERVMTQANIAIASRPNAIVIVYSRPILSDTQPNNGRVKPFVTRSMVNANGSAAIPNTMAPVMPKSLANAPICEITIKPDVDIMDIIKNINQKTGVLSIVFGATPDAAASTWLAV